MDYNRRHPGPEYLDQIDLPDKDLFRNYRELHTVNRLLGGYRITLKGLSKFNSAEKNLTVLDAGCGGGDTLKAVVDWARNKKINCQLTGIDLNNTAIQYARENCKDFPEIEFIHDDIFHHLSTRNKYDVIISCLFMHHLSDEQIILLLSLMNESAELGILINDLQRHPFAYQSIKFLTKCFSKSYLVKHDAPLSVLRGFSEDEWKQLFSKAFITTAEISWEWAFRYLVVYKKEQVNGFESI
ncbi:MAG: methyltransferase domain-containing protein [Chitinophagales bacterium]|nr:methyltransferase domain-containing protein [Chitinophagales bacterium]